MLEIIVAIFFGIGSVLGVHETWQNLKAREQERLQMEKLERDMKAFEEKWKIEEGTKKVEQRGLL
jgi:hypothetical protein